jgi:hypothetical protein
MFADLKWAREGLHSPAHTRSLGQSQLLSPTFTHPKWAPMPKCSESPTVTRREKKNIYICPRQDLFMLGLLCEEEEIS